MTLTVTQHARNVALFELPGGLFINATQPLKRKPQMQLTAENVRTVAKDVLFTDAEFGGGEAPANAVMVDGIVCKYAFHPERLEQHRTDVATMLAGLDDSFMSTGGGGMSFLQACVDREGNHWAEHPTMGLLFALGMGLGLVSYTMPREMWTILPGGMPYLTIDSTKLAEAA